MGGEILVSSSITYALTFQVLVSFLLPIVLIIYFKRKNKLSWRSLGIGILIFLLFVNILERLLHSFMLDPNNPSQLVFSDNPFFYCLYGILAAALFEEIGRFVGFTFFLKKNHSVGDGLSYGLGHGGVEVFTIGLLGSITGFLMIGLINNGELTTSLSGQMTTEQIEALRNQFVDTPAYYYILSGLERIAALGMQLFLSLVVLLGVRKREMIYIGYAVFAHAVFNVAPALYQIGVISNVFVAETIIFAFGLLAVYGIKRVVREHEQIVS